MKEQWRGQSQDYYVKDHIAGCQTRIYRDKGGHVERCESVSSSGKGQVPKGVNRDAGHPSQEAIRRRP